VSYRAEQVESTFKPEALKPAGIQSASSETGTQNFNDTYKQALASRGLGTSGLPEVSFTNGSDAIDYATQQTGTNSFSLGVNKIDVRNTNPQELGQKFDGIADGLSNSIRSQITAMAEDSNYVNKGLLQIKEAVNVAANYYGDKFANADFAGFTHDVGEAGTAIKQASDTYDKASPKQQGEVIGAAMAAFLPLPALARETEVANEAAIVNKGFKGSVEPIELPSEGSIGKDKSAQRLESTLDKLEEHEKKIISDKNISFTIVDNISDVRPGTPDSVQGLCRMYDGGTPQIFLSKTIEHKDFPFVLRHELGHAIDRTFFGNGDRIAFHPKFLEAYKSDLAKLSKQDAIILERYCEPEAGSGPRETFASLYAHSMGTETDIEREMLLKDRFPNTYKLMTDFADHLRNG